MKLASSKAPDVFAMQAQPGFGSGMQLPIFAMKYVGTIKCHAIRYYNMW